MATKTQLPRNNEAAAAHTSRGKVAFASFPRFLHGVTSATCAISAISVPLSLAVAVPRVSAAEVSITTLTGQEMSGDLENIEAGSAHLKSGGTVAVSEIRRLHFPGSTSRPTGVETVFLSGGSILTGSAVVLNDEENIALQLAVGGSGAFPIDAVRGVRLLPTRKDSLFERQLAGEGDAENDRVYVPQETELRELAGVLESLGSEQISIDRDGAVVELPRSKVYGVLFANAVEPDVESLNAIVQTTDGSTFRGSISGFRNDTLQLTMVESTKVELPARHIASIRLQPPNLVYASDLTPKSSVVQPVLAPARDWQRDLNITGNPLRLGSRTFEKGVGMAGGTQITFENPGNFKTFTALVGIDSERGDRGDCEAVVTGGGKELARHRLRGNAAAVAINVDVSSAPEIVLTVEPGEDYDLSDHVNWGDAAFLKK